MHEGKLLRSFLRLRVIIDITQPLTTSFQVSRREKGNVWVLVKYEKLQDYYYTCGVIGHDQRLCNKEKLLSIFNPKLPRYGLGLGVPRAKSMATIIRENEARKMKNQGAPEKGGVWEHSCGSSASSIGKMQQMVYEEIYWPKGESVLLGKVETILVNFVAIGMRPTTWTHRGYGGCQEVIF